MFSFDREFRPHKSLRFSTSIASGYIISFQFTNGFFQVSNRDQKILKLNTELNTVQEQFKGTKEENEMHLSEIERLNSKLKNLAADLKDSKEEIEELSLQVLQKTFLNNQILW